MIDLIEEITKVREILVYEVSRNLRQGKEILREWTDKALALSPEALLENRELETPQRYLHRKAKELN